MAGEWNQILATGQLNWRPVAEQQGWRLATAAAAQDEPEVVAAL